MISNIQATEEFNSRTGWNRKVSWDYDGIPNSVECNTREDTLYESLLKTLVDAQIDKKVPYSRVIYVRGKKC